MRQMTRSQARALKQCSVVKVKIGKPRYSEEKFQLYLAHKDRFNALHDDVEDDQNFKLSFYVPTPFGIEFEYYLDHKLIGVALGDVTSKTFSAIYTFYKAPDSRLPLGTFSILKQLEFSREKSIRSFRIHGVCSRLPARLKSSC